MSRTKHTDPRAIRAARRIRAPRAGRGGGDLSRRRALCPQLTAVCVTSVGWPKAMLQRFMLEEGLLHELGHHLLQHYKGKRPVRIARARDHEAFAARFAEKQRTALRRGRRR